MKQLKPPGGHGHPAGANGFTLIELLVVLGMTAILAGLLLPALASTGEKSPQIRCLNNLRQLTVAWLMYPDDNSGRLVKNGNEGLVGTAGSPAGLSWVDGILSWAANNPDNTNTIYLTGGLLGAYNQKEVSIYKCPADHFDAMMYGVKTPRVRSVSMNGFIEGGAFNTSSSGQSTWYFGWRSYNKLSDLKSPAPGNLWVFTDEHPDSMNEGWMIMNVTDLSQWEDLPANYHNNAGGFSWADGHVSTRKWLKPATLQPVRYQNLNGAWPGVSGPNQDIQWILPHSSAPTTSN